ncbi:uncharacterized protein LOC129908829 [Episyrphus balteatus]|uniref:uncharacterized protein LOC129908829 n=1 Tax=Episyrphus balteatus TaxID=286459 RepID=UPI002484F21C|nr:uncharacterized protein LOC129908829 [Episyrphus balteatus]
MTDKNVEGDEPVLEIGIETEDFVRSTLQNLLDEEQNENVGPSTSTGNHQEEQAIAGVSETVTSRPSVTAVTNRQKRKRESLPLSNDKLLELEEKNLDIKEKRLKLEERKIIALENLQNTLAHLLNAIKDKFFV